MKVDEFVDPYLGKTWAELGARVLSSGKRICVTLGYPAAGIRDRIEAELSEFLGGSDIELDLLFQAPPGRGFGQVKQIVAVASGKGGVGKSTTAVNLALALDAQGAKVGLLDADIYGPSQGMMLGVEEGRRPQISEGKFFEPLRAHGLKAMSMSFMVTEATPMVWRGPMASGALQQILTQTLWGDLDYLIVDMPPGTGDIQLTLSQKAPVSGAVIVTTPQDIALLDAIKGIEMFSKVDIPVLGIVENMSVHECPNCGHMSHLFGSGGGQRVATKLGVPLLGQLPLSMDIRLQTDSGTPCVVADPKSVASEIYAEVARHLAARLWRVGAEQPSAPTISLVDD